MNNTCKRINVRRRSLLSLSSLRSRSQLDDVCWANLAEVVCHHTLEPVHFIGHIAVCPLKNIEPVVDALRTLLSHHAKTNSTCRMNSTTWGSNMWSLRMIDASGKVAR